MSDNPAGWQADPTGKHDHRYWDGTQWTEHVADAGVASKDPYDPVVADRTASTTAPSDASPLEAAAAEAPTAVTPVSSDDTTEYPAAGGPSPYVPPTPVATGGGGAGGRNRSGLVIGAAILTAVAVAVIAFLTLGGDDEPTAPLADESTSPTEAGGRGEETLEDLRDACADGDYEACDLLYISAERGSDLEVFGSTCGGIAAPQAGSCAATDGGAIVPGWFSPEDLMEAYGISEEQAECVAEHLAEAIDEGELDMEEGLSSIFEVAAECDVPIEGLGE